MEEIIGVEKHAGKIIIVGETLIWGLKVEFEKQILADQKWTLAFHKKFSKHY